MPLPTVLTDEEIDALEAAETGQGLTDAQINIVESFNIQQQESQAEEQKAIENVQAENRYQQAKERTSNISIKDLEKMNQNGEIDRLIIDRKSDEEIKKKIEKQAVEEATNLKLENIARGAAGFAASIPQAIGGLIKAPGEVAQEKPSLAEKILAPVPIIGKGLGAVLTPKAGKKVAELGQIIIDENKKFIDKTEFLKQKGSGVANEVLYGLGSGLASFATAGIGLALSGGNPGVVAPLFGLLQKGNSYIDAREKGKTAKESELISSAKGTAEAGLEFIGLDLFFNKIGKLGTGKLVNAGLRAITEATQEMSQSAADATIGAIAGIEDRTGQEIAKEIAMSGFIGALIGGGASGIIDIATQTGTKQKLIDEGIPEEQTDIILSKAADGVSEEYKDLDISDKEIQEQFQDFKKDRILDIGLEKDISSEAVEKPVVPKVGITKKESSLIEEAKKFESVEEFVEKSIFPTEIKNKDLDFKIEYVDSFKGQDNFELGVFDKEGNIKGLIEYVVFENKPHISNIQVVPTERGKGIGKDLIARLQQEFPKQKLDFGAQDKFVTDEGILLKKSLDKQLTDIYNKAQQEEVGKVPPPLAEEVPSVPEKTFVKEITKDQDIIEDVKPIQSVKAEQFKESKLTPEQQDKVIKEQEKTGEQVDQQFEKQKDIWFGEKDVNKLKADVEKKQFQTEIKTASKEKKYSKVSKDYDKAIQIYIDSKRNPSDIKKYYNKLTDEQKRIVDLSKNLPDNIRKIADKISESYKEVGEAALDAEIIRNVLDNYAARIWDIPKDTTNLFKKFGTTTRHAKQRKFGTIIEGWAKGFNLKVEGATNNLNILKQEIIKTIADKQFIKSLQKLKTIDGDPLVTTKRLDGYEEIKHPNFSVWRHAGKAKKDEVYGKNFFADEKGNLFEKQRLYAPKKHAKNLNNILGVSALKGIPAIDVITKYNAIIKSWILQSSFFHHLAFARSYYLGTSGKKWNELNLRKAYKEGLKNIENLTPEIVQGVKNGLTLGLRQDWNEELLQEKTAIGNLLDKWKVSKVTKDKILQLRQQQADFLFEDLGAGLKAKSYLIEYRNLLKKHPDMDSDKLSKMAANLINDDFGGLHLGRIEPLFKKGLSGRNPTVQHIFRLFALAPDWTESNIRSMVKMIGKGGQAERAMYRKFWAGIFTKGVLATFLANILLNGEDAFENYKRAWEEGKLRWLDVDITNIYKALGGTTKNRKYFSILGHFKDPIKFVSHPIRSAKHKGSVVFSFFHEALTGMDWAGRRFTTAPELVGIDKDKGYYKTTRKGKYRKGQPKWGKLKGQTVTWTPGKTGPIEFKQIPSFILSQIKGSQPVQVQNIMAWTAGEMEGFDAIANSLGLGVATTYKKKKTKKRRRLIKI